MKVWLKRVLLSGILILLLVIGVGYQQLIGTLHELGLSDVHYTVEHLSLSQMRLSKASFLFKENATELQNLTIQWQWLTWRKPQITEIDLVQLNVVMSDDKKTDTPFTLPTIWAVPAWLPNKIDIQKINVDAPCSTGRCLLSASVNLQRTDDKLSLTAHTNPTTAFNDESVELKIDYQAQENTPDFNADFSMTNLATVNIKGALDKQDDKVWLGDISAQVQPPSEAWLAQFKKLEVALPEGWQYYFTKPVTLKSHWNVNIANLNEPQLNLDWQLEDIAFATGKPKAGQALPLLVVTSGHIKAGGTALINFAHPVVVNSNSDVTLKNVSGIYDTTEFKELTGDINVKTSADDFLLKGSQLTAKQITQGIVVSSAKMTADYQSSMANMSNGKLTINKLVADVMGGNASVTKSVYDFSKTKQQIVVELHDIDLGTLLKEYPTSDLSGSGHISGRIPLDFSAKGIRVLQGSIIAQAPGGALQYRSARAAEMAANQPSMKLLLDALHDFHYSLLTSDVTVDDNGKLLLAIKIQGNNPEFQNGRQVNFNFNLEENLPALITSLQLTNQISATIQERIQQKMQSKNAATSKP